MVAVRGVSNMLMELRKICQHPYTSQPELEDLSLDAATQSERLIGASGKLSFLHLLLPGLKQRGHRVLLFSQFKTALDRIEDFLRLQSYHFRRIDGDTPQARRQKDIDAYNAPGSEIFIFLLTTRAGGVGINLASADTVIIHDPDFNPHMDLQAIARAHRYGQEKKVLVFKLTMKQSIEENIMQSGKKKMVLDHLVVQNMDKKDEIDVDSVLLHGARAILEDDSQHDVQYTRKDVDELIERVEADAEAQVTADGQSEKKEGMVFDFAKVWEVGRGAEELADGGDEPQENSDFWATITHNAEVARQQQEANQASRRARSKAPLYHDPQPDASSPSRQAKKARLEDGDFMPVDNPDKHETEDEVEIVEHVAPQKVTELRGPAPVEPPAKKRKRNPKPSKSPRKAKAGVPDAIGDAATPVLRQPEAPRNARPSASASDLMTTAPLVTKQTRTARKVKRSQATVTAASVHAPSTDVPSCTAT